VTTVLDYQWAFSTISKATIQASTSYIIRNFPTQSDQLVPNQLWTDPIRELTKRPVLARYSKTVSMRQRGDGFYEFTLGFHVWTPGQLAYILANQFTSGVQYGPATVQLWSDDQGGFAVFNCEAQRPVPGQDYDIPATDGALYWNIKQRFEAGVLL
jgi:hypothetical protein